LVSPIIVIAPPDDHFTAGPDRRVMVSSRGRSGRADGRPTISAGSVSPAGVQKVVLAPSPPNDHFTPGPDCSVLGSGFGRIEGGRSRPCIICARRITSFGNFRKSVHNLP